MITIIGAGPGSPELMTPEAAHALSLARVAVGGGRLLRTVPLPEGARLIELPASGMSGAVISALEDVLSEDPVLLVSGDTGFYSLAQKTIAHFGRENIRVIPGISSLQIMSARIGRSWVNVPTATLHGRNYPEISLLAGKLTESSSLVVLLGGSEDAAAHIKWLAENERLASARAFVGWDLGLREERLIEAETLADLTQNPYIGRLALLWLESKETGSRGRCPLAGFGAEPQGLPSGPVPDEWFERADGVPMTKAPVRAVLLSLMQPLSGASVLEIGSGSGAVTVELLRAVGSGGRVTSIELNERAFEAAQRNIERSGLGGAAELIPGRAPEEIPDSRYDAVFIGGHGEALEEILKKCWECLRARGRLLVTAISPRTTQRALAAFDVLGADTGFWRLQSSVGKRAGSEWLPIGNNPVDIIWGDKRDVK